VSSARVAQFAPATMIAQRFVEARRAATALADFPGPIPSSLPLAYACQNIAIDLWGEEVAGWKVGRVAENLRETLGAERLVGAIFRSGVMPAAVGDVVEFPVFVRGFAAVEAEFVYRLGKDAPADKTTWSAEEALDLVEALHIGIETAGSPLATINDLGSAVVAADFGNNNGLILGPVIQDWRRCAPENLVCETAIDGIVVGRGDAASLPGGPPAALTFTLGICAEMGRPLRAGALVSSGAVTGVHEIRAGQGARVSFGEFGAISCLAAAAKPTPERLLEKGASL
jgi:2-keto-4-pentenoate hydratase